MLTVCLRLLDRILSMEPVFYPVWEFLLPAILLLVKYRHGKWHVVLLASRSKRALIIQRFLLIPIINSSPGYVRSGALCELAPAGTYSPYGIEATACDAGTSSPAGSTSAIDCVAITTTTTSAASSTA
jgi:hypothetical protein